MSMSHVLAVPLLDIYPLEQCFPKFEAHFSGWWNQLNGLMIRICKTWTETGRYQNVSQVIGYLLHETSFSLSGLCTHRCVSWCKTSFLRMSHGQRSLKATALDKFSYICTSRHPQVYCSVICSTPKLESNLCVHLEKGRLYTLVIKWNPPSSVVNGVVFHFNTNVSQCWVKKSQIAEEYDIICVKFRTWWNKTVV